MPFNLPRARLLKGTATLDFPSILAATTADMTLTVSGATPGDSVVLGPPASIETNLAVLGFVSANDTVTVRLRNLNTLTAIDPVSAMWTAWVIHG